MTQSSETAAPTTAPGRESTTAAAAPAATAARRRGGLLQNPIVERELIGMLRTRKAMAMQVGTAFVFALLVLLRWPSEAQVALSGAESIDVFRLFGYGLMTTLVLLVPVFPATAIVREKVQGTLPLLLNSPMSALSIYWGKLAGLVAFVMLPLLMSLPAAAACYAMGGVALVGDLLALYSVLFLLTLQYTTLGLAVSSRANSIDGALRITYGLVLMMVVVALGPYQLVQGKSYAWLVTAADWLRCVSPIPAVMELLGHGDAVSKGLVSAGGAPMRFIVVAGLTTIGFMVYTVAGLKQTMLDRSRWQGIITEERGVVARWFRRLVFLVDPQRRKKGIGPLSNPVMVKEFRSRRFGRSHWMLRLVAACALVSLLLTYAATAGTLDWGVETIGGIMVVLQVALIVLITPSLAAGLISLEHESGGWTLLRMTPLSTRQIVLGKLVSVVWTLLLVLLATLPGYLVMMVIMPVLAQQIVYVLLSLAMTAGFALLLGATVSSFFRRTAPATVTAYSLLVAICGGTMLVWLARDAPFGHDTVRAALLINPMAAALEILEVPAFTGYDLMPANWWIVGVACLVLLTVLGVQTWRLTRPQ
jgi:ABC-type transport system involved in multi-copper enzyme maturation permease subunit